MLIHGRERESWSSFYSTGSPTETVYIDKTTRQTPTGSYLYVVRSLFTQFSATSNGGCIYLSNTATDALIEESSFTYLSSTTWAISIYIAVKNAVYNKVCGFDAKTTVSSSEVFDSIQTPDSVANRNEVYLSSFSYIKESPKCTLLLSRQYGKQLINSLNVSMNECKGTSGIYCYASYQSGSISTLISYSSFTNNSAVSENMCICFKRYPASYKMQTCNVISNKQSNNNKGLIASYGEIMINDTCILNNEATLVVAVYNGYTMTLMNTFLDKQEYKTGTIVIENGFATSFVNALIMLKTGKCDATFDKFGDLGGIVSKKKRSICYKSIPHCRRNTIYMRLFLTLECSLLAMLP